MAHERKLGRTASQRKAMLRNLTTNLLWYGRIETTEAKAKEVRSIVDKMITLAINNYDKTVEVEKEFNNDKQQIVKETCDEMLGQEIQGVYYVSNDELYMGESWDAEMSTDEIVIDGDQLKVYNAEMDMAITLSKI